MDFYAASNNIARSYMGNYYQFCHLSSEILKTHQHLNPEVTDEHQKAIELCQLGLTIEPKNQVIMGQLATINWRYGQWLLTHGKSPDVYFQESLQWGEKSLAVSENADAWTNQGIVYDLIALQKLEKGLNPEQEISQALSAYDRVNILNPGIITDTTGNQLYALNILSQYQVLTGEDVSQTADKALELISNAQQKPEYNQDHAINIYNNFAYIALLAAFSDFNHQAHPNKWLDYAIDYYTRIETDLNNKSVFSISGLGETYWFQAEIASRNNLDIKEVLNTATLNIDEALALSRQYYWMPLTKSKTLILKVKSGLSDDADADMILAKTLINESVKLNPLYADSYLVLSYWHYMKLYQSKNIEEQLIHYENGIEGANQAIKVNAKTAEAYLIKTALTRMAITKGLSLKYSAQDIEQWNHQAHELNPVARLWHLPSAE